MRSTRSSERGRRGSCAVIGFPGVLVVDAPLLLRALAVYKVERIAFAEAYLVTSAEASGVGAIDETYDPGGSPNTATGQNHL
jgi:hypothetical protein